MQRNVQHTTHLAVPFELVCRRADERGNGLLAAATRSAVDHIEEGAAANGLEQFDAALDVSLATAHLVRTGPDSAEMALDWNASSPQKRLLPNLSAKLILNGVILKGPHASTAVSIVGQFDAPRGLRQRFDNVTISRKIVDEAVGILLASIVDKLGDESLDVRGR